MLRLQNLTASLQSQVYSPHTPLYLRILIGKINKTTSEPACINNQYQICWHESMTITGLEAGELLYPFQIFGKEDKEHKEDQEQKGDRQREGGKEGQARGVKIRTVLRGKIGFSAESRHEGSWDIFFSSGKKAGILTSKIISTGPSITKNLLKSHQNLTKSYQTPSPNIPRILRILSMVAKLPSLHIKRAYFCIEIGEQLIRTPELKSRAGELVFMEPRQIELSGEDRIAGVKIYGRLKGQNKEDKEEEPIAEGVLELLGDKNMRRVVLMKDSFQAGELYMEIRIAKKSLIPTTNHVENPNKDKTPAQYLLQQPKFPKQISKQILPQRYSSLDYSRLDTHIKSPHSHSISNPYRHSNSNSRSRLQSSILSTTSSKKRTSVLNQNATIMFPREKRFMIYQDRQNQKISYLGAGDRSFQFGNFGTGRYKGASFGYGDKTDFADRKNIPGVGYYKLPSIWDRY